jgi:hypothetical protein
VLQQRPTPLRSLAYAMILLGHGVAASATGAARPGQWPPDRAILLHELLHAYHHQVLRQPTPAIGLAHEAALRKGTYPAEYRSAYFLSNAREYFAVIGEIYLSGGSFRPPFNCGAVQESQPDFIKYLEGIFGRRPCHK